MKVNGFTSTRYMATIYDGHSHIERRVFVNDVGDRYVRINGFFASLFDLRVHNGFDIDVWYEG